MRIYLRIVDAFFSKTKAQFNYIDCLRKIMIHHDGTPRLYFYKLTTVLLVKTLCTSRDSPNAWAYLVLGVS